MKNKKAFSLVELVIVIAVIGVLTAVLLPTFGRVLEKAKASSAMQKATNAVSEVASGNFEIIKKVERAVIVVTEGEVDYFFEVNSKTGKIGEATTTPIDTTGFDVINYPNQPSTIIVYVLMKE